MSTSGFDIDVEAEKAGQEDGGIDVHIHGVDEKPMFYEGEEGERRPVIIRVAGEHSTIVRRIEARQRKRKINPNKFTGESIQDDTLEKAAGATLSWDGFFSKGQPVRCDEHNALQIYKRCPWVLDQIIAKMKDHGSFFEEASRAQ